MNDALRMLVATGIVLLAATTLAQQFWRDREAGLALPYPGAAAAHWDMSGGGALGDIAQPRLSATRSSGTSPRPR